MNTYFCRVDGVDRVSGLPAIVEFVEPCKACGRKHKHGFSNGTRSAHCGTSALPVVGPTGPKQSTYSLVMPTGADLAEQIAKARKVEAPWTRRAGYAQTRVQ